MTVSDCLLQATDRLKNAGINTARLDALVLLEDALDKDRSWLLAHPETILQGETLQDFNDSVERRLAHEPLAYIRGHSEFYGRDFLVTADTLQPRAETETMIDLLKTLIPKGYSGAIVDIGTGSGCLAITAKLEWPNSEVLATEINKAAILIAAQNSKKLKADVTFYEGDLAEPLPSIKDFIVLANLPYVPDSHTINQAAMHEPKVAIFGGSDGLDLFRRMFEQLARSMPKFILTESLPFQHEELAKIAEQSGYKLASTQDFIQVFES